MRFVEYYGIAASPSPAVEIHGRSFSAPSLVEDDDGIRMLLVDDPEVLPLSVWTRAHSDGAAVLLYAEGDSRRWMSAEAFLDHRTEHHATASFRIPARWHETTEDWPTYAEMALGAREEAQAPEGESPLRFVHMHTHTEFSALDGLSHGHEIVAEAVRDGQIAAAITDHGTCAGHPAFQKACDEALTATGVGIKPIFGIEAYFVDDRHKRGIYADEAKKILESTGVEVPKEDTAAFVQYDYRHMTLWAMTDAGLRNIWAMSTEANREGLVASRPRMDWDTLERHNADVMASTGCLRGPVAVPLIEGDEERARANLARLMEIYPDRLYVEIHTNHLPEQIRVNHALVALAREYGLPLLAAVDSHYPTKDDAETHAVWIATQTKKDLTDDSDLFAGQQDYHVMTEAEVREALSYLDPQVVDEAVENTARAAERCNARIAGAVTTPVFSKVGGARRDVERLVDICMENWERLVGWRGHQDEYMARFEREMGLLISKGFAGYFLMVADYCLAAKEGRVPGGPVIVGPGRGSGGGSLVALLAGITSIDPVDADLLFERFLTEGRVALPDFDVDFPASRRSDLMAYVIGVYGEEYVMRVGTNTMLQNKGVVRGLAATLKSTMDIHFPDIDAISKIIDDAEAGTAGLGLSWEDLWIQAGDLLDPWRVKYPRLFDLADKMVGRLKSYGKHPAGVVIATDEPLTGRIPMRAADGQLVAEFDMNALESLGLVKFDFLTLRTLDTIQETVDEIRRVYGIDVDVYSWQHEYDDPMVWEELGLGHTKGVFQIETRSGTQMVKRFRPQNLHELADVITLVRPGPMRSGLTETYLRRRAGAEPVEYADPRLESVLSRTYGCLLYQEDIMAACMVLAGYDSNEADAVRKILGKKQVEKVAAAGVKFVNAAVERGMTREAAEHLWAQMAEFAKYSFNRAHAYGYAVLGYWTAWFKFNYPVQFLRGILSTLDDKNRIPEFVYEARRMGYQVLPPDINVSGSGFLADGVTIRYGFDSVKGIGEAAVPAITRGQPYTSFADFMERKGDKANMGIVKTLAAIGAFDSLEPRRKMLEERLLFESTKIGTDCRFKDSRAVGPNGLPCTFDWANEVDPPMVRRRVDGRMQLVVKDPPKRCTTTCRNYTAPVFDAAAVDDYTDAEIMEKELAALGLHLSRTPFDRIPQDILEEEVATGEMVEEGPEGEYLVAAIVQRARPHTTRTGKPMGFIGLLAQTSEIDVTVFTDAWAQYGEALKPGTLCFAWIAKNDRGLTLKQFQPV